MKLATGLWVWGSLLVATGTVQPSASQSGGSRGLAVFPLALQLLNPPPPRVGGFLLLLGPSVTPWLPGSREPEGPGWLLAWVAPRSNPNLPLCVCGVCLCVRARACVFNRCCRGVRFSCLPRDYLSPPSSLFSPLLSFSRVFWEPKRDRFWWRPLFGAWETEAGPWRFSPPPAGQGKRKKKIKKRKNKETKQTKPKPR